jgi:hypothetical protein
MRPLSRREQIYMGVFVVALLWGLWNFRGSFGVPTASAPARRTVSAAAPAGTPHADGSPAGLQPAVVRRLADAQLPPWGRDPFHRQWRTGHAVPGDSTEAEVERIGSPGRKGTIDGGR